MMEGLGRAIKMVNVDGRIQGIRHTTYGEANTHQQFVDDTMLQGIPTIRDARAIKNILNDFSMVAGTKVSLNKSKVFFFNTNINMQRNITRILGFQREQIPSKYLGVPLTDKLLSKKVWEPILNKIQDKSRKWTSRSLNLARHLVLTQAVLQAIPTFVFLALPAPQGIKQLIRNIQRDFIWGREEEKNKWALVARDKLCKPKSHGGLGLHDPQTLSKVSGAKIWWIWIKDPNDPRVSFGNKNMPSTWQKKDHIRMSGKIRGSHIWNLV